MGSEERDHHQVSLLYFKEVDDTRRDFPQMYWLDCLECLLQSCRQMALGKEASSSFLQRFKVRIFQHMGLGVAYSVYAVVPVQ